MLLHNLDIVDMMPTTVIGRWSDGVAGGPNKAALDPAHKLFIKPKFCSTFLKTEVE